ncbi:hypothetical protein Nepgr_009889 [Nepenthes gracilis]|uniref:Uncharacterized protein n=1 Tax=Nepenthes gracilis TaxID=150966 RepID=A0AAD3SC40_NEPGR|nr:hypothetical protein Nepgr_009889 [Nepenthes gracilis]
MVPLAFDSYLYAGSSISNISSQAFPAFALRTIYKSSSVYQVFLEGVSTYCVTKTELRALFLQKVNSNANPVYLMKQMHLLQHIATVPLTEYHLPILLVLSCWA